jgi:asparagine synthase (glutamine-hydrolysing)
MCGICGIIDFNRPVERDPVGLMMEALRHRGPDDEGLAAWPRAGLGFRRLSIIDLAGSHQPMSNEDDSVWMVFNGEIYNYRSLRDDLLARGHAFKTAGDGETILHLYEEEGLGFPRKLNGMFSVALWDARRERLVLTRDHLGIKPLYYRIDGGRLVFASETKAILAAGGPPPDLDMEAVTAYMNYSSVPGWRTFFKGIRRILPGHLATFDRSGFSEESYWDVKFDRQKAWDPHELEEALESQLRESVRMQMVSDVPLGVFLSGGVDSSLVAALMAQESARPVQAFTVGYGAEGAYLNETRYARAVAERYGMDHHDLILDAGDLLDDIERVAWHLDEPCGDPAAFLTLALSRFTRRHVTVALSGLGADEIFCGYRRYVGIAWQRRYTRLPRLVREGVIRPLVDLLPEGRTSRLGDLGRLARKFVNSMGEDVKTTWSRTVSYLPRYDGPMFAGLHDRIRRENYASEFFEEFWARVGGIPDPVDRVMYVDMKMYMVDQLLLLQDKMSMAVSLEARVPYLDHRLVDLAATIPAAMKLAGNEPKSILKKLAEKHVPRECIYRSKQGFGAPVEAWLRGPLRDRLHDALTPRRVRDRGLFQVDFIEWLKRGFYENGRDLSVQLYQVFLLEVWMTLFLDGKGRPAAGARGQATRVGAG